MAEVSYQSKTDDTAKCSSFVVAHQTCRSSFTVCDVEVGLLRELA
jgi:hypothetical protein